MKNLMILFIVSVSAVLFSCAGGRYLGADKDGLISNESDRDSYAESARDEAPMEKKRAKASKSAAEVHGGGRIGANKGELEESEVSGDGSTTQSEDDESVIIYEADCSVSVKRVKDSVKSLTDLAKEFSGYIEGSTSSDSYRQAVVVIRVPSKKFDPFLAALSRIGEVQSREVRATNVSDEYRDLSARLVAAQKILERLNALLQKEIDMQARIAILKEIDRVTAQIESFKARIAYLKGLADFATVRVTLTAESRTAVRRYMPSPFPWIRNMNPDARSLTRRSPVSFSLPEGFFSLEDDFNSNNGLFLYTLPGDTVGIRTGAAELYPKADMQFWKKAFAYDAANRLYKVIDQKDISADGVYFALYHCKVSAGKYYSVAFAVNGTDIVVVEALYRDEDTFKAHRARVEQFVATGGKK